MKVVVVYLRWNSFNDAIGDISEEDLMFMELLNKPKSKSTLTKN